MHGDIEGFWVVFFFAKATTTRAKTHWHTTLYLNTSKNCCKGIILSETSTLFAVWCAWNLTASVLTIFDKIFEKKY